MRYQQAESGVISGVWGAHVFVLLVVISPILGCNVVDKARTLRLLALLRSFLLLLWYMKLGLSGSNQVVISEGVAWAAPVGVDAVISPSCCAHSSTIDNEKLTINCCVESLSVSIVQLMLQNAHKLRVRPCCGSNFY